MMKPACWQPLIEGMIEAVWIVDALELRIIAANQTAAALLHVSVAQLTGKPVVDLAATPEDVYFWEDVAAGLSDHIFSETLLVREDGSSIPVERQVTRIVLTDDSTVFVVSIRDLSEARRAEGELEQLVAELRATLESTADGILVTDFDGAIRGYNQRFAELWALPQELMTQRDDTAIYAWMARNVSDAEHYAARLAAIAHTPLLETTEILHLRSGLVLERVTLPQYARGQPIGRVFSFRDISRQLADAAQLNLAAKVFEASLDAIFVTDADFKLVAANPSCAKLSDFTHEALIGMPASKLIIDGNHKHLFDEIKLKLDEQGFWEGEAWHHNQAGRSLPCLAAFVRVADANGTTQNNVCFFKDLTETLTAQKRIEELAYTDALTGLPNRLMLTERIEFAIGLATRDQSSFALLFLDLDHFKHINDSLGHMFGDRVLVEVSERIKDCLRQVDTAARLGGDEFLMLLHNIDMHGAEVTAQRILDRLAQPFEMDELSFTVTCSIGVALFPDDGRTMDDLIKNADTAMYNVKERGRAGFRFYQRQMNVGLLSRMKLDHAMRQALANQDSGTGFRLHYQPQIDLATNTIFGAEALLRWREPDMGEIAPAQFIPIAEESGLIVNIGNWVLREAIRQCALWNDRGLTLIVGVNVSALQFQQADFVAGIAAALQEHALPPHCLELELTESILIQDIDETLKRLEALAQLGVQLAIDDFGTGYSSLAYLKRFPIHKLKIDRSFVNDLPADDSDAAIVGAIISMAGALGLRVIAEGVETDEQRVFLISAGCDEYQGYLCAPALAPAAFEELAITIGLTHQPGNFKLIAPPGNQT